MWCECGVCGVCVCVCGVCVCGVVCVCVCVVCVWCVCVCGVCVCTTASLSIHLLMGILVASRTYIITRSFCPQYRNWD